MELAVFSFNAIEYPYQAISQIEEYLLTTSAFKNQYYKTRNSSININIFVLFIFYNKQMKQKKVELVSLFKKI
jgi:hypothetical protein